MAYKIGNIYEDFINIRECAKFNFDGKNAQIVLLRKNISEEFIKQINEDEVFFQLFLREEIIFLLIKFASLNWLDIAFVCHHNICELELPPCDNHGYAVRILLADAMSGKLYTNRLEAFSHGLSKALYWAVKEQLEHPPQNIARKINKVCASFSAQEMARLSLGKK